MNPRTKSQDIRDLSQNDIRELVAELGQPAFRAKQLIEWVFEKNVCSFDDMTNLPKAFREQLKEAFAFDTPTELTKQVSKDGSRKYLLEYHDGVSVETVGMPRRNKLSVCVSTQAGCGMGCAFCATGLNGLKRSLTAQEIVDQVLHVSNDFGERATSVVFMGQGEPFANYDEVLKALRILNDPNGIGIGARHLTVSTSGVIPGIRKFADIPEQFTLAVSLHTTVSKDGELDLGPKMSLFVLDDTHIAYHERTAGQHYENLKNGSPLVIAFANLEKKQGIIEQLKALAENAAEATREKVQALTEEYNKVGHVPYKEKDKLYEAYHEVLDRI